MIKRNFIILIFCLIFLTKCSISTKERSLQNTITNLINNDILRLTLNTKNATQENYEKSLKKSKFDYNNYNKDSYIKYRSILVMLNKDLANKSNFDKEEYFEVLLEMIKQNKSLATLENYNNLSKKYIYEYSYFYCFKKDNKYCKNIYYIVKEIKIEMLGINPLLLTLENYNNEMLSDVREEMIKLNKQLSTQNNYDNEPSWSCRLEMIYQNNSLLTEDNYKKEKNKTFRKFFKILKQKN